MSSVLVIGAGIGGLAIAARLAKAGQRVTVLEKNGRRGGRTLLLDLHGYRFDTGPTLFLMPAVFAETYAALGERMEDQLDLMRVDPTYRIHFHDGSSLDLTSDLIHMCDQIDAIQPGSFQRFLAFMEEGYRHHTLSLSSFVGRNFRSYAEYFSPANLPLLFKLKALQKHAPKGAAFGLSHDFWQVGYLRPRNRHERYGNLYFAGASTHPGTGLPIVVLAARLVAERIAAEQT